ncbi:MAG: hemerythrin domain-containing protein [Pyrinomonadaceae bacterium]
MDAFELLQQDHKKVAQLFEEIEATSGQAKKQVFSRLKGELDLHAQIEERIFYPALENKEEAREITLEAYEEHKVVKDLLGELASGSGPEDEWDAKLKVLRENVEHHVEEEEGELFSKARQALSKKALEELGAEMEAAKGNQQAEAPPQARSRSGSEVGDRIGSASNKGSQIKESPGVLKRLASLVGLSDRSTGSKSTGSRGAAKRRSPAKPTKSGSSKKSAKKTNAAKRASKTGSKKSGKKATKKSGGRSTDASRGVPKKSAPRRSGAKKTQGRTAKKRSR